ncbi:hypothetical protein D1640_07255 [Muribaculaceae bacterium S4]|nr:hypothetical protein [Muribaculaceae bacterium S4]
MKKSPQRFTSAVYCKRKFSDFFLYNKINPNIFNTMDEKITITAEFSQTDVAAALMCLGEELTPERWEQIKAAPSKIDFSKIKDKSDRMQVKLGLISMLFLNLAD